MKQFDIKTFFKKSNFRLNGSIDDRRVSEQTWMVEANTSAAARLTKRIDTFLDLEATSEVHSESYQVCAYGRTKEV